MKCRLHKGDEVVILTGKCRGETGKIERIDLKNDRVFIAGKNIAKRHTKPNMQSNQDGGIVEKVMPLHISNVAIIDPSTKKPSKVGFKIEGGQKIRVAKLSGTAL